MRLKKFTSRILVIFYTLFLLISIPYIRTFQDFVRVNKLKYIYDILLVAMCVFLFFFIAYNLIIKKKLKWKDLGAYGFTIAIFIVGLLAIENTVERVHFLQYGVLVFLVFNFMREKFDDLSIYVWTFLISLSIGILDEWIQWWLPSRFGEVRDIYINLAAVIFGLLCIAFMWRPKGIKLSLPGYRWRSLYFVTALIALELTSFLYCAHIGFEIYDKDIGFFRSLYTGEQLLIFSKSRSYSVEQQVKPLVPGKAGKNRYSISRLLREWKKEDFYKTEAEFHVGSRNRLLGGKKYFEAFHENKIIEKYYFPLISQSPMKWSQEEKDRIFSLIGVNRRKPESYYSDRFLHIWTSIQGKTLWALYIIFAALLMLLSRKTSVSNNSM